MLMMIRWICIYIAVVVIHGESMLSDALPPLYPTATPDQEKKVLDQAEMEQLNDYINKYLFYFERRRQRGVNDHIKQTMHVVKLLIVQSWLTSTLEPAPGLLTIPEKKKLEDVKESVIKSITDIEHSSSHKVTDYIIYYMDKLEPHISNKLESEKNSFKYFEKVFYDDEKVLAENHDDKTITLFQDTWNGILDVLNEIRSNTIIHQISSRMILQSYIENFVLERDKLGDKFTLTSSDGSVHEFDTPDSGINIFSDIQEITSKVDKDISAIDKIKYEVYYHILNERIKKYLEGFEKLIETYKKVNAQMGKAMGVVKRLMIHGWIEALVPGPEFFPIEKSETLESTKDQLMKELTAQNVNSPISDAILLYTDEKEQQIEKDFKSRNDSLALEYKEKTSVLKSKKETPENKDEISQIKKELLELERKINIENDNLIGHKICKLLYLNSYRENFIPEQQRNPNFRIEASKNYGGKILMRNFNVPSPIVVKDFFSDYIKMDLE